MVRILAGHQGRRSGGDARPVLAHTTPTDEKGKKVAWTVTWLALVMGVMMRLLSMVLHRVRSCHSSHSRYSLRSPVL